MEYISRLSSYIINFNKKEPKIEGLKNFADELTKLTKERTGDSYCITETGEKEMKAYRDFINDVFSKEIKLKLSENSLLIVGNTYDNMLIGSYSNEIDVKRDVMVVKKHVVIRDFNDPYEIFQIFGNIREEYVNKIDEGMKLIDKENGYFENEEQFNEYLKYINKLIEALIWKELKSDKIKLEVKKHNLKDENVYGLYLYYKEEIKLTKIF
jgi:predicted nuclease of restriction endonuclease-like RecB superfamily